MAMWQTTKSYALLNGAALPATFTMHSPYATPPHPARLVPSKAPGGGTAALPAWPCGASRLHQGRRPQQPTPRASSQPNSASPQRGRVAAARIITREEMAYSGHLLEQGSQASAGEAAVAAMLRSQASRAPLSGSCPRLAACEKPAGRASVPVPVSVVDGHVPAARCPAVPDGPGAYVITHHDTLVSPAVDAGEGEVIGSLPAGAFVNVLEVVHVPEEQSLHGRIEHPPGWIPLVDASTGYSWAEPYVQPSSGGSSPSSVRTLPGASPPHTPMSRGSTAFYDPYDPDLVYY